MSVLCQGNIRDKCSIASINSHTTTTTSILFILFTQHLDYGHELNLYLGHSWDLFYS